MGRKASLTAFPVPKAQSEIRTLENERAQIIEEFRVTATSELSEAEAVITTRTELLEKAER